MCDNGDTVAVPENRMSEDRLRTVIADPEHYEANTFLQIPGRIVSITRRDNDVVEGVLYDDGLRVRFAGPVHLFQSFKPLDLVVLEAQLTNHLGEVALEVRGLQTLTPCSLVNESADTLNARTAVERRALPELEFVFNTSRGHRLRQRPKLVQATRHFLDELGFIEVDTPFLVPWPDIAPVPPVTVAAGRYVRSGELRIANTEFMRRLLVGGFDRVYQLGRCFRDESPSWRHEVEFTQLTFAMAYSTYTRLMDLIEELTMHLLSSIGGSEDITFQGQQIDLRPPWRRVTVRESIHDTTGIDILDCRDHASLKDAITAKGISVPDVSSGYGGMLAQARLLDAIIDDHVIPTLDRPTWLYEYPYYLGGPAKEVFGNPEFKMRAEVFVRGIEVANISVPQNDQAKVRAWYEEMFRLKCENNWDSPYLDEPYLKSMELGIPNSTTGGLGFDRLLMLLLDAPDIRDILLFPSGSQYPLSPE